MLNPYANGFLTALGVLILFVLVFVLPLLSEDTVYRAATLFGGLNAGILTTAITLDGWATHGKIGWEGLTQFLLATLPKFYTSSLIIGALIIPKYILRALTGAKARVAGLLGVAAYYFLALLIPNVTGFIYHVYVNSPLSLDVLLDFFSQMVMRFFSSDGLFNILIGTIMIVSALVSMVATTAIIQKTEDLDR